MKKEILCTLFSFMLFASFTPNSLAKSSEKENTKAKLEAVQQKIKKLEKTLYHSRHQEKSLTQALSQTEKEIGNVSEKMRSFKLEEKNLTDKAQQLEKDSIKLSNQCAKHQSSLLLLMQNNLEQDRKEKLKMLLSQQDINKVSQIEQCYQYFYAAKSQKIKALQSELAALKVMQNEIATLKNKTKTVQDKYEAEKKFLENEKSKRSEILSKLSQELIQNEQTLSKLSLEEKNLESLLANLEQKLKAIPLKNTQGIPFTKLKKKLTFPLVGNFKIEPHPHLSTTQNKKSYIRAKAETPVHAIASGRVVFSEWLRGIGLLIIVDHGNGYMSLYGNNQKLYKSLGDLVQQGEMIARVGQSGGHAEPGLYFEIRKDGKALDPSAWLG